MVSSKIDNEYIKTIKQPVLLLFLAAINRQMTKVIVIPNAIAAVINISNAAQENCPGWWVVPIPAAFQTPNLPQFYRTVWKISTKQKLEVSENYKYFCEAINNSVMEEMYAR